MCAYMHQSTVPECISRDSHLSKHKPYVNTKAHRQRDGRSVS